MPMATASVVNRHGFAFMGVMGVAVLGQPAHSIARARGRASGPKPTNEWRLRAFREGNAGRDRHLGRRLE
jgi:hypothetical protein